MNKPTLKCFTIFMMVIVFCSSTAIFAASFSTPERKRRADAVDAVDQNSPARATTIQEPSFAPKRQAKDPASFQSPFEKTLTPAQRRALISHLSPTSMTRSKLKKIRPLSVHFENQDGKITVSSGARLAIELDRVKKSHEERLLTLDRRVHVKSAECLRALAAQRAEDGEDSFLDKREEYDLIDHAYEYEFLLKVITDPRTRCYKDSSTPGRERLNLVYPVKYTYTDKKGSHTYDKIFVMAFGINPAVRSSETLYSTIFHACFQNEFKNAGMVLVDAQACIVNIGRKQTLALKEDDLGTGPLPADDDDEAEEA